MFLVQIPLRALIPGFRNSFLQLEWWLLRMGGSPVLATGVVTVTYERMFRQLGEAKPTFSRR